MRTLELLAPAKNVDCGIAAISHGADAVYIGAEKFGARAAAGNNLIDIADLCKYAHSYGAKVYVTVNTIIYENELSDTQKLLSDLKRIGVDAVLIQDMGLVAYCRKIGLPIHASTQTDNRDGDKVEWLYQQGFRRVVLARELSIDEMRKIHEQVPDVELEAFVHGALCVSYSGVCYASQFCMNRSANRGECAQMCRLKYSLVDKTGTMIDRAKHYLSLKDMYRLDYLEDMSDAGIVSFKIEGRLKNVDYVKNVVAAYSQKLNELVARRPHDYKRASLGKVVYSFQPNLQKTFNRGYTDYFLYGRKKNIDSFDTPKALGEYVGQVKDFHGNSFRVAGTSSFANGDGLCFFNDEHELVGFRINRADGNQLYPTKMPLGLKKGKRLYRNNDEKFNKLLASKTADRKIPITMSLRETECGFTLRVQLIELPNVWINNDLEYERQIANSSQRNNYIQQLTKLGNTPFTCEDVELSEIVEQSFIPSSILAEFRRKTIKLLEEKLSIVLYPEPKNENNVNKVNNEIHYIGYPQPSEYRNYPYLYNISNSLAYDFYLNQGMKQPVPAFELQTKKGNGPSPLLMQCKHCIRYTYGYCVKNGGQIPTWHEPLFLQLPNGRRFRLQFDCQKCQMNVFAT